MATHEELIALALKSQGSYNLSEQELIAFVKAGAIRAYKAGDSARSNEEVHADFNAETKKLRLSAKKPGETAASEINDEATYKAIDAAISAMRKEIEASWKHANTDLIQTKFQELKGQCLPAEVLQGDSLGSIPVAINTLDAALPASEQIPGEELKTGASVLVFVKELAQKGDIAEIIVSRREPALILHAMKLHIPEVDTGNIEVKGLSRIPGKRSRVAVFSNDLSAVERCEKRSDKVSDEFNNEKVEFVDWYSDTKAFIVSSLCVEAREVHLIESEKQALVEVFKDSAEKKLDEKGESKKLAEELTGYKIEIKLVQRGTESELPGI